MPVFLPAFPRSGSFLMPAVWVRPCTCGRKLHHGHLHGGNLHQSRHYSQFLALQLKARQEAIATPVYGIPSTHHLG